MSPLIGLPGKATPTLKQLVDGSLTIKIKGINSLYIKEKYAKPSKYEKMCEINTHLLHPNNSLVQHKH